MYNKGDNVIYGSKGVCVIEDITTVPFENAPKDKMYYVLFVISNESKIYVPVDIADSRMRKVLDKTDAKELIKKIPSIEPIEIRNEKQLEDVYKNAMHTNDSVEWIRLIKCIHSRRQQRLSQGKQMTSLDKKYMDIAEDALYLELGTALGIEKGAVLDLILKEAENNK